MRNKLIVGILSIAVLFSTACKRETMVGAKRGFATKDFKVTTCLGVNKTNPNFTISNKALNTALFFNAQLSEDVNWTIKITSDDSGAEMNIEGKGKTIDVTNAVWQGESTSIRMFAKYDTCYASLSVLGIDTPVCKLASKIIILKMMSYDQRVIDGVRYIVVDDFEDGSSFPGLIGVASDAADNGTPAFGRSANYAIEGRKSYHMEGTDINKNGWLVSINNDALVEIAKKQNLADSVMNVTTTDPNELYFNIYVRGTGQTNSSVELKAYEIDSATSRGDLIQIINNGFLYNSGAQANNDGYIYDLIIDWEGWKLVSIPYSKFRAGNDLMVGGNGNRIKEPWKISAMAVSLLSYPTPGLSVSADIDFVVLSQGGPFVPKY